MNNNLKYTLKHSFDAPPPQKKAEFLRQFASPAISNAEFVWMQLRYMRKSILLISVIGFALILFYELYPNPEFLWVFSALSPFLAMTVVITTRRSYACGMEEMEYVTRFSLKSVVLARMGCLSVLNGVILLAIMFIPGQNGFRFLKAGIYMLLPYCTTISLALPLTRKYHGSRASYFCVFASALVSACVVYLQFSAIHISTVIVGILFAAEIAVIISESVKLIRQMEDLTWNYN